MKDLECRLTKMEQTDKLIMESLDRINAKLDKLIGPPKCQLYVSGMDTSGRCDNCGKHQSQH